MAAIPTTTEEQNQPHHYQIRIKGHIDHRWRDYFHGLSIKNDDDGTTLLTGQIADQSALYGLLRKVRDSGLPLLSVNPVESIDTNKKFQCRKKSHFFQKGEPHE